MLKSSIEKEHMFSSEIRTVAHRMACVDVQVCGHMHVRKVVPCTISSFAGASFTGEIIFISSEIGTSVPENKRSKDIFRDAIHRYY